MKSHHDGAPHADPAAPRLLVAFVAATTILVGAVVAVGLTDDGWVVAGAIALLLLPLGLLLGKLNRDLDEAD